MRLIDAEPIMKFIEDALNEKDPQKHIGYDGIRIMTEIEFAKTIEPRGWTPCAEGSPEDDKPCYVTVLRTEKDGSERLYVVDGYFAKGIWFDKGGWKINSSGVYPWGCVAIAWQLNVVPEPYRDDHPVDPNKKIEEA